MLIEYGADINAPNINHLTIAERALNLRQYCQVLELLDLGYSYRLAALYHSAIMDLRIAPDGIHECHLPLLDRLERLMEDGEYENYVEAHSYLNRKGLELARNRRAAK